MESFIKAKRKLLIAIVLIAGVAGYAAICAYYWHQSVSYVSTNNAYVQSAATADVKPKQTAKLEEWDVQVGTKVKAGEVLGRLDGTGIPDEQTDILLRAPVSGTVIARFYQPGEVVPSGAVAARVADLSKLQVVAYVEETERYKVRIGAPVEIRLDATPGRVYRGTLTEIGDASALEKFGGVASTGGTFTKKVQMIPVTISFTDPPGEVVVPGMSAEVRIDSVRNQDSERGVKS